MYTIQSDPNTTHIFVSKDEKERTRRYTEKWAEIIHSAERRKQAEYFPGDAK